MTADLGLIPHAAERGITLILENHYKDNFWTHPEFAQKTDVFCDLVGRIHSPHFGVNYDPSNALLAGGPGSPSRVLHTIDLRDPLGDHAIRYVIDRAWRRRAAASR